MSWLPIFKKKIENYCYILELFVTEVVGIYGYLVEPISQFLLKSANSLNVIDSLHVLSEFFVRHFNLFCEKSKRGYKLPFFVCGPKKTILNRNCEADNSFLFN